MKKNTGALLALLLAAALLLSASLPALAFTNSVHVTISGSGSVSVECKENGSSIKTITTSQDTNFTLEYGSSYSLNITSTPSSGYTHKSTTSSSGSFEGLTGDVTVSVVFEAIGGTYTLSSATSGGSGSVTLGKTSSLSEGEKVDITAVAEKGYVFTGWSASSGSFADSKAVSTTYTMPAANATVQATFETATQHTLTVEASGKGGTVKAAGGKYYPGERILLEAVSDNGYLFNVWKSSAGGALESMYWYNTWFVMPNNDVTVTGSFYPDPAGTAAKPSTEKEPTEEEESGEQFTVTTDTTGGGSVSASALTGKLGDQIELRATPDTGYRFAGWVSTAGGSFSDAAAAFTVFTTPGADTTVVATFVKDDAVVPPSEGDDPPTDQPDGEIGTTPQRKSFPWLIAGIGAAVVALAVGGVAVFLERRNKVSYSTDDEYTGQQYAQPKKRLKDLFKHDDEGYNDDDF